MALQSACRGAYSAAPALWRGRVPPIRALQRGDSCAGAARLTAVVRARNVAPAAKRASAGMVCVRSVVACRERGAALCWGAVAAGARASGGRGVLRLIGLRTGTRGAPRRAFTSTPRLCQRGGLSWARLPPGMANVNVMWAIIGANVGIFAAWHIFSARSMLRHWTVRARAAAGGWCW